MYIFKSSIVKKGLSWAVLDVSNLPMAKLYRDYQKVLIVLTHPAMDEEQQLDLADIRDDAWSYNGTVNQYLASIGESSLPTNVKIKSLDNRVSVTYASVALAGFTTDYTNFGYHPDVDVPRQACTDVILRKEGTDYEKLARTCVFTIGGFTQKPKVRVDGVVLTDALLTMSRLDKDQLGMFNLGILGDLTYLDIGPDNIRTTHPIPNNYADTIYLTHAKEKINYLEHDLFLVLGGVFHPLGYVHTISENVCRIDMEAYPIIRRFLETFHVNDYDGVKAVIKEEENLVVAKLLSNEGIAAWLADPSTFIIAVKRSADKEVCLEENLYSHSGVRGSFIADRVPTGLLINDAGFVMDYTVMVNDVNYDIASREDLVADWIMGPKVQWNQSKVLTTMKNRTKPFSYSDAREYLLYYLL